MSSFPVARWDLGQVCPYSKHKRSRNNGEKERRREGAGEEEEGEGEGGFSWRSQSIWLKGGDSEQE